MCDSPSPSQGPYEQQWSVDAEVSFQLERCPGWPNFQNVEMPFFVILSCLFVE